MAMRSALAICLSTAMVTAAAPPSDEAKQVKRITAELARLPAGVTVEVRPRARRALRLIGRVGKVEGEVFELHRAGASAPDQVRMAEVETVRVWHGSGMRRSTRILIWSGVAVAAAFAGLLWYSYHI